MSTMGKKIMEDNNNSQECSDCDLSDNEMPYDMYYGNDFEMEELPTAGPSEECGGADDPERFQFECLRICDVERLLNEAVQALAAKIPVRSGMAKALLDEGEWEVEGVLGRWDEDKESLLKTAGLTTAHATVSNSPGRTCRVCTRTGEEGGGLAGLGCGHGFCGQCWAGHAEAQLGLGVSTRVECMEPGCGLRAPEEFVLRQLGGKPDVAAKYARFAFRDHVAAHSRLRFCPSMMRAMGKPAARKVKCGSCGSVFCFQCGLDYHAPTSCDWIRKWLVKCADDSETANYITANTKDCPNCHSCIEKNGGCNHMQCAKCKHHFCWMCLQDWKQHGSEYYECSRYKENPSIVNETVHVKARAALEKYLFYFERWENHAKSLRMEEALYEKMQKRVSERVGEGEGTWIDWQFLDQAARLLTRSRYTLQYTYPYAYFSPPGARKELFEYQQAQLEKEIEELSWKVERAETSDHGAMERQMHVIEQKRRTLLQDFLSS